MSFDWQVEQNDEVKARKKYFTISLPENSELFIQGWRSFSHEALCKHFFFLWHKRPVKKRSPLDRPLNKPLDSPLGSTICPFLNLLAILAFRNFFSESGNFLRVLYWKQLMNLEIFKPLSGLINSFEHQLFLVSCLLLSPKKPCSRQCQSFYKCWSSSS